MVNKHHKADLDKAEKQLKQSLKGEATVSRKETGTYTDDQLKRIKKAKELLKDK